MSVELLKSLSLISYILGAVFLLVSAALFFALDIKKIIGDLSGANARKAIENIQKQNESGKESAHRMYREKSSTKSTADKMSAPKTQPMKNVDVSSQKENGFTVELDATTPLEQGQSASVVDKTTVLETHTFFVLEVEMGFLGSNEIIG